MAMGSYALGASVRIPLQVTEGGIAETGSISPYVQSIIKPNGTSESGFPVAMSEIDSDYGTYYYDYTPAALGDYIVIITYTVDSQEYTTLENFTVKTASRAMPRAESR
jgi:hypothetical protein